MARIAHQLLTPIEATLTCSANSGKCKTTLNGAPACNFRIRVRANKNDLSFPSCSPKGLQGYLLSEPQPGSDNDGLNAGRVLDALETLGSGTVFGSQVAFAEPVTADTWSAPINITLPVNGVSKRVKLKASTASGESDSDTLTLQCNP